ncbi:hypothetical protein JZ751_024744, partial [Albula glossodonta]
ITGRWESEQRSSNASVQWFSKLSNGFWVEVQLSVRSRPEVTGSDMELLPLRDLSVKGRGEHWVQDFRAILGPLCFL